jgi:hypothetical protein
MEITMLIDDDDGDDDDSDDDDDEDNEFERMMWMGGLWNEV